MYDPAARLYPFLRPECVGPLFVCGAKLPPVSAPARRVGFGRVVSCPPPLQKVRAITRESEAAAPVGVNPDCSEGVGCRVIAGCAVEGD